MAGFFSRFDLARNFLVRSECKASSGIHKIVQALLFLSVLASAWIPTTASAAVEVWSPGAEGKFSSAEAACDAVELVLGGQVGKYSHYDVVGYDDQGRPNKANCWDWFWEWDVYKLVWFKTYINTRMAGMFLTCPDGLRLQADGSCTPITNQFMSAKNAGCPTNSAETEDAIVSNPCNAATGNKIQVEDDLPDLKGTHLAFIRTYNSLFWPYTVLGSNWRHNYDYFLEVFRDGGGIPSLARIRGNDGSIAYFSRNASYRQFWCTAPKLLHEDQAARFC
jgi:hypothetical protein